MRCELERCGAGSWGSWGRKEGRECSGQMESMCNSPDRREQVCLGQGELAQLSTGNKGDNVQGRQQGPGHTEPYRPLRIRDYSESNGKSEAGSVV